MNKIDSLSKRLFFKQLVLLLFWSSIFGLPLAHAQLSLGGYVGAGVQTVIEIPSFAHFYKPVVLPQVGFTARYEVARHLSLRGGLSYDCSGFRYQTLSFSSYNANTFTTARVEIPKVYLGASIPFLLVPSLRLEGFADLAYGIPIRGVFKDHQDAKVVRRSTVTTSFYNHYLGMNLGASLAWRMRHGIMLRISPTAQFQLSSILGSDYPNFHFAGLAPRFEVDFPIPHKVTQSIPPRPCTNSVRIIDED